MEGTYPVGLGAEIVGRVRVKKQGLYYEFDCQCQPFSEAMYDIYVQQGPEARKLGLLAPGGMGLMLRAKIQAKQLGQGSPTFSLRPRHAPVAGRFVPLRPQEPFAYLRQLEHAYLVKRDGQPGLILKVDSP